MKRSKHCEVFCEGRRCGVLEWSGESELSEDF